MKAAMEETSQTIDWREDPDHREVTQRLAALRKTGEMISTKIEESKSRSNEAPSKQSAYAPMN